MAKLMWVIVLGGVGVFEGWAALTHSETMSHAVQHGPVWFKWSIGLGLGALLYHLYRS